MFNDTFFIAKDFASHDISPTSKDMVFIFKSIFYISKDMVFISNDISSTSYDMVFIFKSTFFISKDMVFISNDKSSTS